MAVETELLTLSEAAEILRLQTSTLRSWRLNQNHLNFIKLGGRVFVRRADVRALIAASVVPAQASTVAQRRQRKSKAQEGAGRQNGKSC